MRSTRTSSKQISSKTGSFSKDYVAIRKEAESNWPAWKVSTHNANFATSKHARKVAPK